MAASSSKRKLYEYLHALTTMREDQTILPSSSNSRPRLSLTESTSSPTRLQFFVRMLSERTLVIQALSNDTIMTIHQKIESTTGIPIIEQRLIYRGKQLQWEDTLAECDVQNDAGLQLVGRMLSTGHPQACQLMDDVVSMILYLYRNDRSMLPMDFVNSRSIKSMLEEFLSMTPPMDSNQAASHLQIFASSSAPAALVMLYTSSHRPYRDIADVAVRHFVSSIKTVLSGKTYYLCASIVFEFCKLLMSAVGIIDPLFTLCRSSLATMVVGQIGKHDDLFRIRDIVQFIGELAAKVSKSLELSMENRSLLGPSLGEVKDFTAFMIAARKTMTERAPFCGLIKFHLVDNSCPNGKEITKMYEIFKNLLQTMDDCLQRIDEQLEVYLSYDSGTRFFGWCQYLTILKELNGISRLYEGAEELFWEKMKQRKNALCYLIIKYANMGGDHLWVLKQKEVTNFETRRHLAMMMFPKVKEELHEIVIDRSRLLEDSFQYIAHAEPKCLHGGLLMEFKNENATGPGVIREWFFLLCQAIFSPQNALFIACPKDRRRFYPNPASKVDPLLLEYFTFSGRVIALALMHRVQVGIVFDRMFFLQLAGKTISLEDIKDADPYLYSSCKQILEMDPEVVDQDVLGLTFVDEVDEMGSKKLVELYPGGKCVAVNSENRKDYVDYLIRRRFVVSISEQVAHFAKGFADIITLPQRQRLFFRSLEFEDLDCMLHGSESAISLEEWKAHTDYNGYKETDPQISWFWKIVGQMSKEQKRVLLFFWTSIKYLPFEGFGGLKSRLFIYKTSESTNRLPSARTCFNRLCFPAYPSISVMRKRLCVITQEHVCCSFGTG